MTDNQSRTLRFRLGFFQCLADFFRTISVDGYRIPAPGFVFHCCIFVGNFVHFSGELDVVGIVKHNQV